MLIKAIFFDFDGVLTLDKTGSLTTTRSLSDTTGIDLARIQAAFRGYNNSLTLGKTTHADIWNDLCSSLGSQIDIGLLTKAFESTPLNARMLAMARSLRTTYSVGIITDNKKDRIDHLERLHSLSSVFNPIVVSAEVGSSKESPEIFLHALHSLNVSANECVFIDNSQKNLIAPQALGIHTLYFDDEKQDFLALFDALRALDININCV